MHIHDDGVYHPSPECQLPEPIRPEGDAGIMVTATCPHCSIKYLLVNKLDGEEWIEAQAWWDECSRNEQYTATEYYWREDYPRNEYYEEDLPYLRIREDKI